MAGGPHLDFEMWDVARFSRSRGSKCAVGAIREPVFSCAERLSSESNQVFPTRIARFSGALPKIASLWRTIEVVGGAGLSDP